MEKSTSNFYLDYNATSPLSPLVKEYLERGDFHFANPSSQYQAGKSARKQINKSKDFMFSLFGLNEEVFQLVFNSGATEGINTLIFGAAFLEFTQRRKAHFYFSPTDHACVVNLKDYLINLGHEVHFIPINENGEVKVDALVKAVQKYPDVRSIINWTWLNNETGVVNALEDAVYVKNKTGADLVVDSVQAPGKITYWRELAPELDAFTFSSHKFGGLKGVGFSFISDNFKFSPMIIGGGQQAKLRSGTENTMAVQTTELALRDLVDEMSSSAAASMLSLKNDLEEIIIQKFGKSCIVGNTAKNKNLNTINFIVPGVKATLLLMAFDLEGLQVSSGSACSSGANIPSRVLQALGVDEKLTRSGIRLSFSRGISKLSKGEVDLLKRQLEVILARYQKNN